MTKRQKQEIAYRVASAIVNVFNRTGDLPPQIELEEAIMLVLEDADFEARAANPAS